MKLSTGILSFGLLTALVLCSAANAAEDLTPAAAAQSPSLLKSLLEGQDAATAAQTVTDTVNAAKDLGLPADATTEALALISAAAIASSGPDTAGPIAGALVEAAGSNYLASVVAAIVLAAGTEPWAGQAIAAALESAGEAGRAAAEEAIKDPVKTLGEELAAKVVRLAARVRKSGMNEEAKGDDAMPQDAANAGRYEAPFRAIKYKGQ